MVKKRGKEIIKKKIKFGKAEKIKCYCVKDIYKKSWDFIKSLQIYIWIIAILFIVTFFIGILFPSLFENYVLKVLQEIIKKTKDLGFLDMIRFIFVNNLQSAFLGLFFGMFFGIFPVVMSVINGYFIGFVINKSIAVSGAVVLWRLLPHGIFEIPAVIISLAMGLKLGSFIFFSHRKYWKEFFELLKKCALSFIFIVIPLLILAGIIESLLISLIS